MLSKKYRVAVVGATGAVGQEMREILASRSFPVSELVPLASSRSAGMELEFGTTCVECKELAEDSFVGIDIALFSAGASISEVYAPIARDAGCVVIDNSSAWRMDPDVPLVVPEVNPDAAALHRGIIANPNCSTIQMVVALKPLHDEATITRVVVSTYQAVSGTGTEAISELIRESDELLEGVLPQIEVYPYQIAFNCLPHIDSFLEDGSTKEEQKMVDETKKIMGDDSIAVTATCVRVPVENGHSEAVNVEFARGITPERARELLERMPGVLVTDDPASSLYPMPIVASGTDPVYVGRIRRDPTVPHGLNMWVVADNLRKGAALNAVQIAELLIERDLVRVPH
ncbi:MAG TPA: aspartate-semialdehyde dehydrogenase [Thermoleophilia bacterium]|nr:aspartate-semialdehyde dehydrogenase [Thermoleophilia bacterium]